MPRITVLAVALLVTSIQIARSAELGLPADYSHQLQARSNLLINDAGFNLPPGASFNSISAHLNDSRQVTFRVQVVPGTGAEGVWFGAEGSGALVCFGEDNADAVLSDPRINNAGIIVYKQAFGSAASNGLQRCNPLAPPAVRLSSQLGTSDWGSPEIDDAGVIGYRAGFNGPQAWVSRDPAGVFAVHVSDLTADPASPYDFLFSPTLDRSRRLVGVVRRAPAGPLPQFTELRRFAADGGSELLARARAGDPASPIQGFDTTAPASNATGQVAFAASLVGGVRAVFRVGAGGLVEIARVGVAGITTIDFFGPAIDDAGRVVFRGRDATGRALFVGDGTNLRRVIGQGDRVMTDRGLAQLGQNDPNIEIFSGRPNVNAVGDIAYIAGLHPDGNNQIEWGSGVFVARADADVLLRDGFELATGQAPNRPIQDLSAHVESSVGPDLTLRN